MPRQNVPAEIKSFPAMVKELDHTNRVAIGFAAIFGNLDSGNDVVHSGAFKKTLQENMTRIKFLWQHDFFEPPIATVLDAKEVGKGDLPKDLKEAHPEVTGGLLVTRKYLDTERGREVWAGISSDPPAITEMSFAYDPIKVEFEDHEKFGKIRHIRELRAYDFSDVNWGMNALTRASKGGPALKLSDEIARMMFAIHKIKAEPGLFDDEIVRDAIQKLTQLVDNHKVKPQDQPVLTFQLSQKLRLEKEFLTLLELEN